MKIEWTYKGVAINDIRKVRKFYILSIENVNDQPIFVDQQIFQARVNSYYLRDSYVTSNSSFTREEVLDVKWNMIVTKGFFFKIDDRSSTPIKVEKDLDKYYISFLEIDGPLGTYVPQ